METAISLQNKLSELIHGINNVELLNAVYTLLKKNIDKEVVGYELNGTSFTKDMLIQRALVSEEDIKHSRFTKLEDLLKESENW